MPGLLGEGLGPDEAGGDFVDAESDEPDVVEPPFDAASELFAAAASPEVAAEPFVPDVVDALLVARLSVL